MPEEINNIDGRPAIETDELMSIQEANVWALEQRSKADVQKAVIERLRRAAAQRRERKPVNPLETLKPDPSYRVREFNAEADAFNVESSDGKKLLGKSLSNGNVKSGQKVRSFFAPNGQIVIDVKPKGRDIALPKPQAKPPIKDPEIWPCTVAFLYSRIKPYTERLTDNGAAVGDETSWDFVYGYSNSGNNSLCYVARQRFDELGDYFTAQDAIDNKLKPDRLIAPSGTTPGAAKDNAVIGSGSADDITIWFYVGNPDDALTDGRIVQVSGPSFHPYNVLLESGPGYCMEIYRGGGGASAIFPDKDIGSEPLTQYLVQSFPDFGGMIGYAGRVERWRGMQDYTTPANTAYFKGASFNVNLTPTSTPSWYIPDPNESPYHYTGSGWFTFGWPGATFLGCASNSWINIDLIALNATTSCGASIANDKWFWGGDVLPFKGTISWDNPSGFIGTSGIFVCWRGHLDHAEMAQGYFEVFRNYWGITGSVTKLGSANPYGCELPSESGGGYPPPPPNDVSRFISHSHGRKAEIWLKICKEDFEPIELKLPFEFAAVIERIEVLGGGSLNTGTVFESGKNESVFLTYGKYSSYNDPYSLENPHATLSIDGEYAYVDILYGAQRIWEEPLTFPVKPRLANMGFGSLRAGGGTNVGSDYSVSRVPGLDPSSQMADGGIRISGATYWPASIWGIETQPRIVKDCFACCESYKILLPTKTNLTATIVAVQKYKRGESIVLTDANPDNEFNNKYLIADYRTEVTLNNYSTLNFIRKAEPQADFATFGGLPALIQLVDYTPNNVGQLAPVYYKNQTDWTDMDWIHYQLQESPRQYDPLNTVLPSGVFTRLDERTGVIFELDGKFDRQARAERIVASTGYGHSTSDAPTYREHRPLLASFPLFVSFKEQLIGNGIIKDDKLFKWFRVSTSSFPLFGQLRRNPL